MLMTFATHEVGPGFRVHVCQSAKFKTIRLKMLWRWPLSATSATKVALLPLVLRRGCRTWPTSRKIAVQLEQMYGSGFDVDIAKIGETHLVEWDMETPDPSYINGRPDLLTQALTFMRDIAFDPLLQEGGFSADYVATERTNLRHRLEGLINDKPRYAIHRLYEVMCAQESFAIGRNGRLEDLPELTAQELLDEYNQLRVGAPCDLYVVGDVNAEQTAELAAALFTVADRKPVAIPPATRKKAGEVRYAEEVADVNQAVLTMGLRSNVGYASPAYPALLVYNGVLGAYPHSKLFVNVREKNSLAYFASSRLESTKGLQYIVAGIDSSKYQSALDLIEAQIAAVKAGDFTTAELVAAQKSITTGLLSMQDDAEYIIDAHMLGQINGVERPPDAVIAAVQAVQPADVVAVANETELDTVFFLKGAASKDGVGHEN